MKDFYDFFYFFLFVGRFPVGCGSKFRPEVAYLEVGSSDLGQIHEQNVFFDEIFKKSNHKNAPGGAFL